ncbi:OmpP1/FadL family transporter [Marinobacterium sediminicola]|uniref:Long-chain fatty acid transport protein n=1 Tax=Marinobacterium sediminicola TaxID=518898 RepID=A0ABY1S0Y6_9GAMM|nr:outer membrane protein transport protein [Marinobacterium sediminicola]ULG70106.1 outer membrane protein transport protein [Marinobacterium sediminicola]SMR74934.1 long-chain fatty acid transport protein [Marinobacterium sediminicola]
MTPALRSTLVLTLASLPLTALATNGYFMHGSSVKAQGMAGVSLALAHDSIKSASNPASLIALGSQYDAGLTFFDPKRSADINGSGFGLDGHYDGNADGPFWIPEAGFARRHSDRLAYGVALYANGGMNTSYTNNPFANFGSSGAAGVDLSQMFVTGSLAYKLSERHSIGAGVTYVYQRFSAEGLQAFDNPIWSASPGSVTNNGYDSADGWGIKLGWQGQVTDTLTLGVSWSSRIETDRFDKYSGLFAEQGGFDVPESYGIGFAWQVNPRWTLAGDWERIEYSKIKSVGNPLAFDAPLGAAEGAGFGWQDIDVFKLGVIYAASPQLTLRAGISHSDQPIPASQTFLNILAPGVIQNHASIGASWQLSPEQSISFSYTRALEEKVSGQSSIPGALGGGEANLEMSQNILGVAWQYRY